MLGTFLCNLDCCLYQQKQWDHPSCHIYHKIQTSTDIFPVKMSHCMCSFIDKTSQTTSCFQRGKKRASEETDTSPYLYEVSPQISVSTVACFPPRCKWNSPRELTISLAAHRTHRYLGFRSRPVDVSDHYLTHWQVLFVWQHPSVFSPAYRERKSKQLWNRSKLLP